MNNSPDILHSIDPDSLDKRKYLPSLLYSAYECGLITDAFLSDFQNDLMNLLAEITDRYTRGRSSSVRTEKAKELLESAMYVISLTLKACPSPENAVELLKSTNARELFDRGLARIKRKLGVCRILHKSITDNMFKTPNDFYYSTLKDGINGFFKLYEPVFSAHEIHITADYPLCFERPSLYGIEFIEKYLTYAEAENAFLTRFDHRDVHEYMLRTDPMYAAVPVNIYTDVLFMSLCQSLLGNPFDKTTLTPDEAETLCVTFDGATAEMEQYLKKCLGIGADAAFSSLEIAGTTENDEKAEVAVKGEYRFCLPIIAKSIKAYSDKGLLEGKFTPHITENIE